MWYFDEFLPGFLCQDGNKYPVINFEPVFGPLEAIWRLEIEFYIIEFKREINGSLKLGRNIKEIVTKPIVVAVKERKSLYFVKIATRNLQEVKSIHLAAQWQI